MLDLINDWQKIDNLNEEKIFEGIRFIRPINQKTYSLFCTKCKNVINSTDDMKSLKENDCCEECSFNR